MSLEEEVISDFAASTSIISDEPPRVICEASYMGIYGNIWEFRKDFDRTFVFMPDFLTSANIALKLSRVIRNTVIRQVETIQHTQKSDHCWPWNDLTFLSSLNRKPILLLIQQDIM